MGGINYFSFKNLCTCIYTTTQTMDQLALFGTGYDDTAFSAVYLQNLADTNIEDAKRYILSRIIAMSPSHYGIYQGAGNPLEIIDCRNLKHHLYAVASVSVRFKGKEVTDEIKLADWFIKAPKEMFHTQISTSKPLLYKDKGIFYVNVFSGMNFNSTEQTPTDQGMQSVRAILWHMEHVLCSNNTEQFTYLIKWLACVVQGKKNISGIYFRAAGGIGKSLIFGQIMSLVFGKSYRTGSSPEAFTGQFNKDLLGALLYFIDDVKLSPQQWNTFYTGLKSVVTEPTISIRAMHKDACMTTNTVNIIISSNTQVLKFDQDDRRFIIIDSDSSFQGNKPVMDKLIAARNDPDMPYALYHYFKTLDTAGFNSSRIPSTKQKQSIISNSLTLAQQHILEHYIKNQFNIDKMTSAKLEQIFKNSLKQPLSGHGRANLIAAELESNGFKQTLKTIKKDDGTRSTERYYCVTYKELLSVYAKKHFINYHDGIAEEDIADALRKCGSQESEIQKVLFEIFGDSQASEHVEECQADDEDDL
jgi:hypothetical protein